MKSSAALGDHSLALATPTLWNELPTEIRHANSILTFKKLLKKALKKHFISLINLLALSRNHCKSKR